MSTTYRTTDTVVHTVSKSIIEKDRPEIHDKDRISIKNERNEYLFSRISKPINVKNYKYAEKENGYWNNARENVKTDMNSRNVLEMEEPNTIYKNYSGGEIPNPKGNNETYIKKKKISEIINKYRNQWKMQMTNTQHKYFTENEKEDEIYSDKEEDIQCRKHYEETNKNGSIQLNVHTEKTQKGVFHKYPVYEMCKKGELAGTDTTNNKTKHELSNLYVLNKTNSTINGQMDMYKEGEKTYMSIAHSHECNSNTNFSTTEREKKTSTGGMRIYENNVSSHLNDKRSSNFFEGYQNEYENRFMYQQKRMNVGAKEGEQIDFKEDPFLKEQDNVGGITEEKRKLLEDEKLNNKMEGETNKDDIFSFRRFLYDSIAFDEFKIKDKFKEIEQIEETIRAKNLLSPLVQVTEKEQKYDKKIVEHSMEEVKKTNKNYQFDEITKSNVNSTCDRKDKNEDVRLHDVGYEETSVVEVFEKKMEGKKIEKKNMVSNDVDNTVKRRSEVKKQGKWEKTVESNGVDETRVNSEKQELEIEASLSGASHKEKPLTDKNVQTKCKIKYQNECSRYNGNTVNGVRNTINANIVVKDKEENAHIEHCLSPIKPGFLIEEFSKKIDKRQQEARKKQHLPEQGINSMVHGCATKNSIRNIGNVTSSVDINKENECSYDPLDPIKCFENECLKVDEGKRKRGENNYQTKDKTTNSYKFCKESVERDTIKNAKFESGSALGIPNFFSPTFSVEGKNSEKEELIRVKERLVNDIKGMEVKKNANPMFSEKEKNETVKEDRLHRENDDSIERREENTKTFVSKKEEPSFLFPNNFIQDRKLERTVKTVYTEEPRTKDLTDSKGQDNMKTCFATEKEQIMNAARKCAINKEKDMQQLLMKKKSETETRHNENGPVENREQLKTENGYPYQDDRKQKMERKWTKQNENGNKIRKKEQFNRNIEIGMQMNKNIPFTTKNVNISVPNDLQYKMGHMLNNTHGGNPNDIQTPFLNSSIHREPNISEKYENEYKMLENMKNILEKRSQEQNKLFFSVNINSKRSNNLRYTNIPSSLNVTYVEPCSGGITKKRNSIITDKVFEEDNNEKSEGKENWKNLKEGCITYKQNSIERLQDELQIINRPKEKRKMEGMEENVLKDEINQKRKLYEEKLRKDFEEKIKLRRQLFEQKKEENERKEHCNKRSTSINKRTIEKRPNSYTEERKEKKNVYESERKNKEKKKKRIVDEYSSDGSYYRQLYKNLYDDECTKKWKSHFYDVSDNLYLQDCSDNFFFNLKKRTCEEPPLASSIDLDLISLSKIKFDDFDYNYLNKVEKAHFPESEQIQLLNSSNPTVFSIEKEMCGNPPLKKPQLVFSDSSDKETSKCNSLIHISANWSRNMPLRHTKKGEKENNILCKLVKNKTKENEVNDNWNDFVIEGCISNDSVSKNDKENKTIVEETSVHQKKESACTNTQENVLSTANKETKKEVPKRMYTNHMNSNMNKMKANEMSQSKRVSCSNMSNGIKDTNANEFRSLKKRSYRNISNDVSDKATNEISTPRKRFNNNINKDVSEVKGKALATSQISSNSHIISAANGVKRNEQSSPQRKSKSNTSNNVFEMKVNENVKPVVIEKNLLEQNKVESSSNNSKWKNMVKQKEALPRVSDLEKKHYKLLNQEKYDLKDNKLEQPNTEKFHNQKENLNTITIKRFNVNIHNKQNTTVPNHNEEKQPIKKNYNVKKKMKEKSNIKKNLTDVVETQRRKVFLDTDIVPNHNAVKDNGSNDEIKVQSLPKQVSNKVLGTSPKKDILDVAALEKKSEQNSVEVKNINNIRIEKEQKLEESMGCMKDSSSTSNKTLRKINILQNEENYIPLDLALNFVMDNQKLKKQVKKENESQKPNKKKTFTQWVMEERKKRLKNNLPIDI